ncbi:MAG: hypothetical protein M3Q39_01560 [Actinomycetota bacterium]|nr:hypothetical protein [Actinomycetota bacterium]
MSGFGPLATYPLASTGGDSSTRILDGLALNQLASATMISRMLDGFDMGQSFELTEVYALSETFQLAGAPETFARHLAVISEVLRLNETMRLVLEATVAEAFATADAPTYSITFLAALVDGLVLTGAATNTLSAIAQVSEALALISSVISSQEAQANEAFNLFEVLTARLSAMEQIVSAAVFADEFAGLALVTVEINNAFGLSDAPTGLASLMAAVNEGLRFSIGFVFNDTPVIALSLNAATKGMTTYTQYPFNSMVEFNNGYYAAGDGGLYSLDGTTDAGSEIVWRIRTGMSNLGTGRNKAMDAAYLGFTATGRVALKCIVVSPTTGEKIVHWYELTETAAVTPRGRRLLVGRGLRSVYWGFELTNVTAGDIELDVVELHPIVLEGRLS